METKRLVITDVWGQQRIFSGYLLEKYGMAVLLRDARRDGLKTILRITIDTWRNGQCIGFTTIFHIDRDGVLGMGGVLCNTPPYNYKKDNTK